jgi:hypothetical protein
MIQSAGKGKIDHLKHFLNDLRTRGNHYCDDNDMRIGVPGSERDMEALMRLKSELLVMLAAVKKVSI